MKKIKKLSVVVPVYNEEKTIAQILKKLYKVDFGKIKLEVVVVDDGSKDSTSKVSQRLQKKYHFKFVSYRNNRGKSYALRIGFKEITGDVVVIQDGDLEYDPKDLLKMIEEISKDGVRVVYGSRLLRVKKVNYSGFGFYVGGLFLTFLINVLYGSKLTDESTGYKMFETNLLESIKLRSSHFEFCPEVTAKILKQRVKIHEVTISYKPRQISEGKKIKLRDFLEAVWTILKYRFVD